MSPPNLHQHIQNLAEDHAYWMLENLGYDVQPAPPGYRSNLIVNGTLHIQVKGATYTAHRCSPGRWQFNTRNHPDVYILRCLGIWGEDFVIPGHAIGKRTNIAIWSRDPTKSHGQWAKYCNRWDVIETELERKKNRENHD